MLRLALKPPPLFDMRTRPFIPNEGSRSSDMVNNGGRGGSNAPRPIWGVSSVGERLLGMQKVTGSTPVPSTS